MNFFIVLLILSAYMICVYTQDLNGCGSMYGCFYYPKNCTGSNCTFLYKWKNSDSNSGNNDATEFTLSVNISSFNINSTFIAIGFSLDQKMGDDNICACKIDTRIVEHYYSSGYVRPLPLVSTNPTIGISNVTTIKNGVWYTCKFIRKKSYSGVANYYSLKYKKYHLLAAFGEVRSTGTIRKHVIKLPSDELINFQLYDNAKMASNNMKQKAHGCLMIITWILLNSFGMIIGRYYKYLLAHVKIRGVPFWFFVHRPILIIATIIAFIAFIIILAKMDWQWVPFDTSEKLTEFIHSIFGIITLILAAIQVTLGFSRCDVGHRHRFLFNHMHRITGIVLFVFSVCALISGSFVKSMNLGHTGWILIFLWLIMLILFIATLEMLKAMYDGKWSFSNKVAAMITIENDAEDEHLSYQAQILKKLQKIKTSVLLIYCVLCTALTFILLIFISASSSDAI